MNATPIPEPVIHVGSKVQEQYGANPKLYQQAAHAAYMAQTGRAIEPWAWISTTCGALCLRAECMLVYAPRVIAYPPGVCVYCGYPAGTRDHLLPKQFTGEARRVFVAIVPACSDCNGRINDKPEPSVAGRRKIAQDSLRKSKRLVLAGIDWTDEQLAEYGPTLRASLIRQRDLKNQVLARLSWPEDLDYDMRAWQKSGIPDPSALGLI